MKRYFTFIALVFTLIAVTTTCKKDIQVTEVTLNTPSLTLAVGEMETLIATVFPHDATNKTVSWTSSNTDVAMITNGIVTAKGIGSSTITVTTEEGNYTATCTVMVTVHSTEWVEISGVKWAKWNVDMPGTFAAKPEDAGMFYQWNRNVGWSSTDPIINSNGGITWDQTAAEGTTWERENDPCPTGWRVPTISELESLVDAGNQWTMINDVNGRIFGSDDHTLFLPAAGHRCINLVGGLHYVDTIGYYWSSSIDVASYPYNLNFRDISATVLSGSGRSAGFSIRCVVE